MVYTDDASVPVRVGTRVILLQKDHDVGMCTRIERILLSLHVIGRVVDAQHFMLINPVLDKGN